MSPRLPDRRTSRVLLIGASRFTNPDLHDLPAVANNVKELSDVLTDPGLGGFDRAGCRVLVDPATPQDVGAAIDTVVEEALDTLVLYYAGHGMLSQRAELFLAVTNTDPEPRRVNYWGVPMTWLRSALAESPARNRILILDCCFSGNAIEAMSGAASAVVGELDVRGTYTLASAPAHAAAVAPTGARFTAFTGELLGALRQGISGSGPLLTLAELFPALTRGLLSRGMPRPQRRGTDLADQIALARNAAYRPEVRPPASRRPALEQRPNPADSTAVDRPDGKVTAEFHRAMLEVYRKARTEAGYDATYFLTMVEEVGGWEAARRLLRAGAVSSGFSALWEKGRLDLSVEAIALQDRFAGLFTEEERETARDRLAEYGYHPSAHTS